MMTADGVVSRHTQKMNRTARNFIIFPLLKKSQRDDNTKPAEVPLAFRDR